MSTVNSPDSERSLSLLAPAKINLVLGIIGPRDDGFHELVSLVAPVAFGDTLHVRLHGAGVTDRPDGGSSALEALHDGSPLPAHQEDPPALTAAAPTGSAALDHLHCTAPDVPTDASNLVLRAALAFREELAREHIGFTGHWEFTLEKRVPAGAGLGGGSSDAAIALEAMNRICGNPLSEQKLYATAASIGSDCPLFLARSPVVMRGRGERLTFLGGAARQVLKGQRVLLFKPSFSINTGWAYGQMRAATEHVYVGLKAVEGSIERWHDSPETEPIPLFNNMQTPVFEKYLALPTLLEQLRRDNPGLRCLMSGSGSACFILLDKNASVEQVAHLKTQIRAALGQEAFCEETALL